MNDMLQQNALPPPAMLTVFLCAGGSLDLGDSSAAAGGSTASARGDDEGEAIQGMRNFV